MNTYMTFITNVARQKPSTLHNSETACPFCDRDTLYKEGVILAKEDPFLIVENKFQTLDRAYQMVLIETEACNHGDLSMYAPDYLYRLFRFALANWEAFEASGKFRSVIFFKNHGVHSGGSIYHPHMQFVGLTDVDYREHVEARQFMGLIVDQQPGVELNLSTFPRAGFTEFNVILTDRTKLDEFSNYIQIAVHFILNVMNTTYKSFNIFFYQFEDRLIAKIILRAPGSPYLMGYSIVQVPNTLADVVEKVQGLYFSK
ncbi:DUF4931 domain-containing protein [Aneurinibacillus uraniidurans]|uniref:DUF4931 domain-containing protein n=1 Tax=Aneurinibacillus uraniidurans TaxID=2966586 RepID=UPI0023493C54|nr:DUF4931 domain-containing protein [Aneurinibacillus sp. B1]WCN39474.1 DUF4931 domain-containing protein [Aneurinibacillus sp. B1]